MDVMDDGIDTPQPEDRGSRRPVLISNRILAGLTVALVVAVGVAAFLVVRAMPKSGEAPRTALEAAIQDASDKVEADPKNVYARLELADAYFTFERYDEALSVLDEARSMEPTGTLAAYVEIGYGRVYLGSGDSASAAKHFENALELEESFDALYALGKIAREAGDDSKAAGLWFRALELDPNAATLRIDLAELYESTGKYDLALQQLEEARRYLPDEPGLQQSIDRVRKLAN